MIVQTTCTPSSMFSGERFSVTYRIYGSGMDARTKAEGASFSSTLSVAFRKFKQLEGKAKRDSTDDD